MIGICDSTKFPTIPTGLIIPYNVLGAAPTGWSLFTAPNAGVYGYVGSYIIGAGSTYTVNTTGMGGNPVGQVTFKTPDGSTATNGYHTGTEMGSVYVTSPGVGRPSYGGSAAGAHKHMIVCTPIIGYRQFQLIKATSRQDTLPANSILLNTMHGDISYLTASYSDDLLLKAGSTLSNSITVSSQYLETDPVKLPVDVTNGDHIHNWSYANDYVSGGSDFTNQIRREPVYKSLDGIAGYHTSPPAENSPYGHKIQSVVITNNIKRAFVTAWTKTSAFYGFQGMIGMWDGSLASIPDGWGLCDGNNGTIDLRDYFVVFGTPLEKGTKSGNNTINVNPAVGQNMLSSGDFYRHFAHWGGDFSNCNAGASVYEVATHEAYTQNTFAHSHTGTAGNNLSYMPQFYALYFIQKM